MGFAWMFAGLLTAIAAYQAYRLVTGSLGRRVRAAHLLMCAGMAAMFAPVAWSVPRAAGVIGYVAAALWCLPGRGPGMARLHAVTGSLAMAYTFAIPGMAMSGMAGMTGMAGGPGGAYAWIGVALAAYFVGETAWVLRGLLVTDRPPPVDTACHMAVGIAMGYMLLTVA